ncbi:MAG: hypothetical protein Q9160_001850 [Pyrenula sp. 1 TL-2023]
MAVPFQVHQFKHGSLGDLKGRLTYQRLYTPVIQFRSIPYAAIPERFKQSVISDCIPEHFDHRPQRDFTQYGNACPHIPQPDSPYGGPLPDHWGRTYEENSCLNLSISAPKSILDAVNNGRNPAVPVMCYIHGGGFTEGAGHTSTLHETMRLAGLSAEDGNPVVFVSIGYRLNWFGFMNCTDLAEESAEDHGDPVFSLGLWDQRNALQWIQRHISGFGGDPSNVTAFGESAGSVSIWCHLCTDVPLFQRAVLMSGTMAVTPTWTMQMHDQQYYQLLQHLEIPTQDTSRHERLSALRAIPSQRLVDAIIPLHAYLFSPYTSPSNTFFSRKHALPTLITEATTITPSHWITSLMIGDTHFEGYVLYALTQHLPHPQFLSAFHSALGSTPQSHALLHHYSIPPTTLDPNPTSTPPPAPIIDPNLFWHLKMLLLGDILISQPVDLAARTLSSSKPFYRYHLCLTNPTLGSPQSFVPGHHYVDLFYLFLTLSERYPPRRDHFFRCQAEGIARAWIRFAGGGEPWRQHTPEEGEVAVWDDRVGMEVRTRDQDERVSKRDAWGKRRLRGYELVQEAWENVPGPSGDEDVAGGGRGTVGERILDARRRLSFGLVAAVAAVTGGMRRSRSE